MADWFGHETGADDRLVPGNSCLTSLTAASRHAVYAAKVSPVSLAAVEPEIGSTKLPPARTDTLQNFTTVGFPVLQFKAVKKQFVAFGICFFAVVDASV
jgi:hypothetical protein